MCYEYNKMFVLRLIILTPYYIIIRGYSALLHLVQSSLATLPIKGLHLAPQDQDVQDVQDIARMQEESEFIVTSSEILTFRFFYGKLCQNFKSSQN